MWKWEGYTLSTLGWGPDNSQGSESFELRNEYEY